jgi:hypothetical protein
VRGELKPMMMIHDLGQRLGVGLIPDVPGDDARQRRERNSGTRISHPREAQIDTIGKDGGEQQRTIGHGIPGAEMREVPPEVTPAIHLGEQVGDLDAGHKPVGVTGQQLRFI